MSTSCSAVGQSEGGMVMVGDVCDDRSHRLVAAMATLRVRRVSRGGACRGGHIVLP